MKKKKKLKKKKKSTSFGQPTCISQEACNQVCNRDRCLGLRAGGHRSGRVGQREEKGSWGEGGGTAKRDRD